MSAENPMATIIKWIANYERHEQSVLEKICVLKEQVAEWESKLASTKEGLARLKELLATLESAGDEDSCALLEQEDDASFVNEVGRTHFERIEAFLKSKNNEPQTVVEIEHGTKIPRTSISAVLYRTHADRFCHQSVPGQRGKGWALAVPTSIVFVLDQPPPKTDPRFAGLWVMRDNKGKETRIFRLMLDGSAVRTNADGKVCKGKWEVSGNVAKIVWDDDWHDDLCEDKDGFVKHAFKFDESGKPHSGNTERAEKREPPGPPQNVKIKLK